MPADTDVQVVRNIYAAINRHDAAAQAALFAPAMVRHDLTAMIANAEGGQAVASFLQMIRDAMPDLHIELEDVFSDGNGRVAARVTLTGTHKGEFLGADAYGREGVVRRDHAVPQRRRTSGRSVVAGRLVGRATTDGEALSAGVSAT
jgi:predicted ester cyclase